MLHPYGKLALLAQYALEDRIHIAKLPRVVEGPRELLLAEQRGDRRIARNFIAKDQILFPRAHGMALHQPIRILAQHAGLGQIEQQLP